MQELTKERLKTVSSILVSQPKPNDKNNPYLELTEKYGVRVDFRPFIHIEPTSVKDFRKQKIDILAHTAVIFTSRNAVQHFFQICKECKIDIPADMKYFCISEQTANFLQKFIVVRKRKIFTGERVAKDLFPLFKKHKKENFLFPCSNIRKDDIPNFLKENDFQYSEMILYKTVASDLSDLSDIYYDVIAFFSPSGISSLLENFPDFKQNNTRLAAFGPTTAKAVKDAGLILDIQAPMPNAPSMTGAIKSYIELVKGTLK